jgi:glycosyltransferase involved in cell wall biosynthesis
MEMHKLYAASDIFVLGSLSEGLPIVVLEAMSSGLSVLVHDSPLFRWTAGDSDVRCINMAKPGALAETLVHAFGNGSRPNARAEALKRFSWESLVTKYVDMYLAIAGKDRT